MLISFQKIPDEYYEEYARDQLSFFQGRMRTLCLTVLGLFYFAFTVNFLAGIWSWNFNHYVSIAVFTAVSLCVLFFMQRAENFQKARLLGFLFAAGFLFVLVYGPSNDVRAFNFAQFILSLIFISLLLPWKLKDVLALIFLHFSAWLFYFMSRDLSGMECPSTIFGTDPFINGSTHLLFSALICLRVRYKEIQRDVANFLLLKDVARRQQNVDHEMSLAARLQQTLIPKSMASRHADIAVTYRLAGALSGDYARFYYQNKDYLIFFIGDVTGHGLPAALLVNRLHVEFLDLVQEETSPGRILHRLNQFIMRDFEGTSMYLSAVCGAVDFKKRKIIYSNYGHPPQYLVRKRSEIRRLETQASLLGVTPNDGRIYEEAVPFNKGDLLLLFTDGMIELRNKEGRLFGKERVEHFILRHGDLAPADFNAILVDDLEVFSGRQFRDDVLILTIRLH